MDYDEIEIPETAPWWLPALCVLPVVALLLSGYEILIWVATLWLGLFLGAMGTVETIHANKTGENLNDTSAFDALWYVFIVARRKRSDP